MKILWLSGAFALAGCASAPQPAVQRTEAQIDLSGEWNDVDADMVAQALVANCLANPWHQQWQQTHGRKPVVRLSPVRNRTDAFIDYRYFTKQFEMALINSGKVEVVSSMEEAEAAREERADQAVHASDDSAKSQGEELGSDFILSGWILSQNDQKNGQQVKSYLTSLELIQTETQKKAWVGQKRIKKLLSAPKK